MKTKNFRLEAHKMVDWMADYIENIEKYPVRSQVTPGYILNKLPASPPEEGEHLTDIFKDFENIIMPGITHWQHPKFFAFFPGNSSPPSILAEMLTAALGSNCMMWETSPAATELEIRVLEWLRDAMGLPKELSGVIQDTSSSATFCAVLVARERATGWGVNEKGLGTDKKLCFYTSLEAHSSVEKAVKMAGLGRENLRLIPVDDKQAMDTYALKSHIEDDINAGFMPTCVVATLGTTGTGGMDPIDVIGKICDSYNIYLHVDAAWAGSALILPEYQYLIKGIQFADSFVFNPHKWLLTNFDCTAHYVRDTDALKRTLSILPEYLKTREGDKVTDFRDWGIQLGRRNRALKLWFVIRSYGIKGLQSFLRSHIEWSRELSKTIVNTDCFEVVTEPNLSLFTFRYRPDGVEDLNMLNAKLIQAINDDGRVYLTRTKVDDKLVIRFQVGSSNTSKEHVMDAWEVIKEVAMHK
ncbi:MAG: pyridoxal phosphate-dependent decarboxylase family protein [Sphingomonadales bacterium]|jgi:aromatic-L-amino-acid decarboxylase